MTARLKLIEVLMGLALTFWCLWTMVPEHRRQLLKMSMAARAERVTRAAARRAGAASMGAELVTGQQNYSLPYALSLLREHLVTVYDQARGITPLWPACVNGRGNGRRTGS
jgi:hypothetical protein